jgi:hypothetical protein
LLLFWPQQGAVATVGINLQEVIGDLLPHLNAETIADLVWWSKDDFYNWANEGAKALASRVGLFVERDASISTVSGTASYALPARHLSTIHASIGSGLTPLKSASAAELDALDTAWETAAGTPERFVHRLGTENIQLYKAPDSIETLALVFHQYPAEVSDSSPYLTAPAVLREWFLWWVLAEARRQEGDAGMPEVAAHLDERLGLMEAVMKEYWGSAQ